MRTFHQWLEDNNTNEQGFFGAATNALAGLFGKAEEPRMKYIKQAPGALKLYTTRKSQGWPEERNLSQSMVDAKHELEGYKPGMIGASADSHDPGPEMPHGLYRGIQQDAEPETSQDQMMGNAGRPGASYKNDLTGSQMGSDAARQFRGDTETQQAREKRYRDAAMEDERRRLNTRRPGQ